MPTIAQFYGISIRIFPFDQGQHNEPHLHAFYQGDSVVLRIPDGEVLAGSLPFKQIKRVRAWMVLRQEELTESWEQAARGNQPNKIDPLP